MLLFSLVCPRITLPVQYKDMLTLLTIHQGTLTLVTGVFSIRI